jgi:hypothetical protein
MRVTASSATSAGDALRRAVAAVAREHPEIRGVHILERVVDELPGEGHRYRVVVDVDAAPRVGRVVASVPDDRADEGTAGG